MSNRSLSLRNRQVDRPEFPNIKQYQLHSTSFLPSTPVSIGLMVHPLKRGSPSYHKHHLLFPPSPSNSSSPRSSAGQTYDHMDPRSHSRVEIHVPELFTPIHPTPDWSDTTNAFSYRTLAVPWESSFPVFCPERVGLGMGVGWDLDVDMDIDMGMGIDLAHYTGMEVHTGTAEEKGKNQRVANGNGNGNGEGEGDETDELDVYLDLSPTPRPVEMSFGRVQRDRQRQYDHRTHRDSSGPLDRHYQQGQDQQKEGQGQGEETYRKPHPSRSPEQHEHEEPSDPSHTHPPPQTHHLTPPIQDSRESSPLSFPTQIGSPLSSLSSLSSFSSRSDRSDRTFTHPRKKSKIHDQNHDQNDQNDENNRPARTKTQPKSKPPPLTLSLVLPPYQPHPIPDSDPDPDRSSPMGMSPFPSFPLTSDPHRRADLEIFVGNGGAGYEGMEPMEMVEMENMDSPMNTRRTPVCLREMEREMDLGLVWGRGIGVPESLGVGDERETGEEGVKVHEHECEVVGDSSTRSNGTRPLLPDLPEITSKPQPEPSSTLTPSHTSPSSPSPSSSKTAKPQPSLLMERRWSTRTRSLLGGPKAYQDTIQRRRRGAIPSSSITTTIKTNNPREARMGGTGSGRGRGRGSARGRTVVKYEPEGSRRFRTLRSDREGERELKRVGPKRECGSGSAIRDADDGAGMDQEKGEESDLSSLEGEES